MLLGQIVAISFAMNLFFLTVLLTPVNPQLPLWTPCPILHYLPLLLTFSAVALIPYSYFRPTFTTILMLPHVVLFFLPLIRKIVPRSWGTMHPSPDTADRHYCRVYSFVFVCSFLPQAKATMDAVAEKGGFLDVLQTLWEHPAVTSVGWDVILCWLSLGAWIVTDGWDRDKNRVIHGLKRRKRRRQISE